MCSLFDKLRSKCMTQVVQPDLADARPLQYLVPERLEIPFIPLKPLGDRKTGSSIFNVSLLESALRSVRRVRRESRPQFPDFSHRGPPSLSADRLIITSPRYVHF